MKEAKLHAFMVVSGNGYIRCDESSVLAYTPALLRSVQERIREGAPILLGHRTYLQLCKEGILGSTLRAKSERTIVYSTSKDLRATARVLQGHESTAFANTPQEALRKACLMAEVFDEDEILLLGGLSMFYALRDAVDNFTVYEESGTITASPIHMKDYWSQDLKELGRSIAFNKNDGTDNKSYLHQFSM